MTVAFAPPPLIASLTLRAPRRAFLPALVKRSVTVALPFAATVAVPLATIFLPRLATIARLPGWAPRSVTLRPERSALASLR